MKKTTKFVIILAAIGVCLAFLWPTIRWYWMVPADLATQALGSKQQIKDYASRMAETDLNAIKKLVDSGSTEPLPAEYSRAVQVAAQSLAANKIPVPAKWTPRAFIDSMGEADLRSALETKYRESLFDLKDAHGSAIQLGLDLAGGMSVLLRADASALRLANSGRSTAEIDSIVEQAMTSTMEVLASRIDKFGLTEPSIRRQGSDEIYVELPGAPDAEKIRSIIMGKGLLMFHIEDQASTSAFNSWLAKNGISPTFYDESIVLDRLEKRPDYSTIGLKDGVQVVGLFVKDKYGLDQFERYMAVYKAGYMSKDAGGNSVPMTLEGRYIESAATTNDSMTGRPLVTFSLSGEGAGLFSKLTSANVHQTLAILLDGRAKAGANIREAITGGRVSLEGFSTDEGQNIRTMLQTASFNVPLTIESEETVGASQGADAIQQGLMSITIGFILVMAFMLLYYKGAGINAVLAQILNLYFMVAILSAFNLTLTLPALAGFVLTIGISVDANVLIFERIKDEMRLGKGRKASIEGGFGKAFWTILDTHLTTLIASVFLSQLGTGSIQGFAITLAIGVLASMFTALVVSRLIFDFTTDVMKSQKTSISWRMK